MPIKIKGSQPDVSPHGQAAAALVSQGHITTMDHPDHGPGQVIDHSLEADHVPIQPELERLGVEMGFKMPVAPYTMVEFRVWREVAHAPGDADAAYEGAKSWVENRINELVAEQQDALPEQG